MEIIVGTEDYQIYAPQAINLAAYNFRPSLYVPIATIFACLILRLAAEVVALPRSARLEHPQGVRKAKARFRLALSRFFHLNIRQKEHHLQLFSIQNKHYP